MVTVLLLIIYIAYIGLGIPDSLFGTAWPAIYRELGLPIVSANYVTLLISGGTVISSLFSARIINRFGTGKVAAVSTSLTAIALFGFSNSNNILWLCLFAVPLGLGAGSIDSAMNNYVALHYKAVHMNFLHCFYGIGVSLSPYLMSIALSDQANWRKGYRIAFYIQTLIALITIIAVPLWNRVKKAEAESIDEEETSRTIKITQLFKMPSVRAVWFVFIGSCSIEFTCGIWGSTFLVNTKGMAIEYAAKAITFYYIGMALSRFLSGLLSNRLSSWKLIQIGQRITLAAIVSLFLPLPSVIACIGLFMIGFGNGPVFPNLIHLTPQNFGKDISQSVMGTQMAASYVGIMLMPPLFGLLAQTINVNLFPYFLLLMFAIMITSKIILVHKLKRSPE